MTGPEDVEVLAFRWGPVYEFSVIDGETGETVYESSGDEASGEHVVVEWDGGTFRMLL